VKTKTKTIPYKSETYTTICYTKPVWVWTSKTSLYTSTETKPYTTESLSTCPETTKVYKTYTTTTPYPSTITSTYQKSSTEYYTSKGSKCAPETKCTTTTAGWGYGNGWHNGGW